MALEPTVPEYPGAGNLQDIGNSGVRNVRQAVERGHAAGDRGHEHSVDKDGVDVRVASEVRETRCTTVTAPPRPPGASYAPRGWLTVFCLVRGAASL